MNKKSLCAALLCVGLAACQTTQQHQNNVNQANDSLGNSNLTVGTVQSQLNKGMTGGEVATVMGSPNIVSTDPNGNEVWIYDKISTNRNYSNSNTSVAGAAGAIGGALGGLFGVSGSQSAGAASSSQKTLTVIIKFDAEKRVRDIAYHTSRF